MIEPSVDPPHRPDPTITPGTDPIEVDVVVLDRTP